MVLSCRSAAFLTLASVLGGTITVSRSLRSFVGSSFTIDRIITVCDLWVNDYLRTRQFHPQPLDLLGLVGQIMPRPGKLTGLV